MKNDNFLVCNSTERGSEIVTVISFFNPATTGKGRKNDLSLSRSGKKKERKNKKGSPT